MGKLRSAAKWYDALQYFATILLTKKQPPNPARSHESTVSFPSGVWVKPLPRQHFLVYLAPEARITTVHTGFIRLATRKSPFPCRSFQQCNPLLERWVTLTPKQLIQYGSLNVVQKISNIKLNTISPQTLWTRAQCQTQQQIDNILQRSCWTSAVSHATCATEATPVAVMYMHLVHLWHCPHRHMHCVLTGRINHYCTCQISRQSKSKHRRLLVFYFTCFYLQS